MRRREIMARAGSVVAAICLLSGCQQNGRDFGTGGFEKKEVSFLTPWTPGGGMELYVRVVGDPYLVEESIQNFTVISPSQFVSKGVPVGAIDAASFLVAGDPAQDLQIIYAFRDEEKVRVFRGYEVPGFGPPIEWKEVKVR